MTTKHSSRAKLKTQADQIAKTLKGFYDGKIPDGQFVQKLKDARAKDGVTFGIIVMDDKVLKIEMPWTVVATSTERAISEWIVSKMAEEPTQ